MRFSITSLWGLLLVGVVVAQLGGNLPPTSSTNLNLNLQCEPDQLLFGCDCAPPFEVTYEVLTQSSQITATPTFSYRAKLYTGGRKCVTGIKGNVTSTPQLAHQQISNQLGVKITTEYGKNNQKTGGTSPLASGSISIG